MSLIKCPECNKKISSESKACVHCGFPIPENYIDDSSESINPTRAVPKWLSKKTIIIASAIVVALVGILLVKPISSAVVVARCKGVIEDYASTKTTEKYNVEILSVFYQSAKEQDRYALNEYGESALDWGEHKTNDYIVFFIFNSGEHTETVKATISYSIEDVNFSNPYYWGSDYSDSKYTEQLNYIAQGYYERIL